PLYPVEVVGTPVPSKPQPPAPTPTLAQVGASEAQTTTDFWTVLTEDLSALEAPPAPPAPQQATPVIPAASPATAAATDRAAALQPPSAAISSLLIPFTQDSAQPEAKSPEPAVSEPAAAVLPPAAAAPPPSPVATPSTPAIPDAQLLALWQHIQSLAHQQAGPLTLARAYLFLGQTCRDRIEAGNQHPDLIDLALEAYTRALPNLKPGSLEWSDGLNDLGSLYWLRSHREPHPEGVVHWLQQSIQAYRAVLGYPQPPSQESLARLYSNLGTVYSLLANLQDPTQNLEQSVRAYHRALQYRPADTAPTEYAVLQNSLGAIHWRLAQQGDTRNQLHRAITAYSEALRYRSPQTAPQEYAMIQNNLGIAYWSLAQHERPAFLLGQAIAAYRSALAHRTLSVDPAGCAATHNNLGTAYWDLAQHQGKHLEGRRALWQQALSAYEAALTAAQRALAEAPNTPLSFDLWATFHSAGVVHDQLAQHLPDELFDTRTSHLDQALRHYLTALEGWRRVPDRLDLLKNALIHNIRLQFQIRGVEGQNAVLSSIPAELLPDLLPQL
ncbi:MAG: tetratricopeptide repeat protein, partial [Cyanobacteria bacterium Co-bin13]|nr:tetratricopeptide repeat protein [Cyanobacteria bacterium Co-bin13]